MMYREIGRTKLQVSALALGTVTLGTVYGFAANPVERQPSRDDALALIRHAVSQGVTLIDAAPAYGTAESLVGAAVGDNVKVVVVMKVIIRANTKSAGLLRALEASLASSRVAFHRGTLDIAQIHNATDASLAIPEVGDVLRGARDKGTVRFLSALAYTADEALAAISSGRIDVLQVPFSVLDQRVTTRVVDAARSAGVGVLSRSALLKGALIERAAQMLHDLDGLRRGADRVRQAFGATWPDLPGAALRLCLGETRVASVLIGASTVAEVSGVMAAGAEGPLSSNLRDVARGLALTEEHLIGPRQWPAS